MKRLESTESVGGFISVCPSTDGKRSSGTDSNGLIYSRGFQTMLDGLDEEDGVEECGHIAEKKRRLSVEQVKALEKNFEVENKLEPERKLKLAQELGLQPRQVAVWFQNRRARWKTKQLERDYGVLKSKFDALKLNFDVVQREKEALLSELAELKSQLGEENAESKVSVDEEILIRASKNEVFEQSNISASASAATAFGGSETTNPTAKDCYNSHNGVAGITVYGDLKDGSSDSDSSAILNEENAAISSSAGILQHQNQQHHQILMSPPSSSSIRLSSSSSPSSINCFQICDSNEISGNSHKTYHSQHHHHQHQYVKIEEQNFLGTEEPCSFFSDEQPPSLHWYCDQWD